MDRSPSTAQRLERLKWVFLILGLFALAVIELIAAFSDRRFWGHVLQWLAEATVFLGVIWLVFREAIRLQNRLDLQHDESHTLSRVQAALIQLGQKLATTHDEMTICKLTVEIILRAMLYERAELVLVDAVGGEQWRYASGSAGSGEDHYGVEIPLTVGKERLGSLYFIRRNGPPGDSEYSMLLVAANQAALAIANARLYADQFKERLNAERGEMELRRRERSLKLFKEIARAALVSPDFSALLQSLADNLGELLQSDSAFIFLWDESRKIAHLAAAWGPLRQTASSMQFEPGEIPLVGAALESGKALAITDIATSAFLRPQIAAKLQSRALLALPLIAGDVRLGVAILGQRGEHVFTPDEVSLGEQAAGHVALAMARARALEAAHQRANELDALQKANAVLLSTLDLESLLGQILDAAISAIPAAEKGSLHLVARDTGQLQVRAVQGYTDARIRVFNLTSSTSYLARAVREHRPLLVQDAHIDPRGGTFGDVPEAQAMASSIIAPLLIPGKTLGAISLDSSHKYAFSQADLRLLVSFATTATTAIQNAQLHTEVQKQAITDTLTSLYNRRGFEELGRREVERALRFGRPLSALLLDIDFFKQVNDVYGHQIGDQVLTGFAQRCTQELRQIDLLGRYGGDEFIALLPETEVEGARQVAERLRMLVSQVTFAASAMPVRITMSVGVAALGEGVKDLDALVKAADQALYRAKRSGRNRVIV